MLSIVVPTYREADNLPALAAALSEALGRGHVEFEIIVADDCSPDNTVEVCEALALEFPLRLLLCEGRQRDLSLSVIQGIDAARFDTIVVMDADLSHPPEAILSMLAEYDRNDSSFVIGSRYVRGGGFDRDWSLWRFLNSYMATTLAAPLVRCMDPMSGFFLFDRRRVDTAELRPIGYKIGLELLVRGDFDDVIEVPIRFHDRERGQSKMNLGQQFKYLRHLRRLYLYRYGSFAEFVHFGVVGASGFAIDVIFYYLLQLPGISHQVARGLSFWPAVSWNWALNRITTFGDRKRRPKARQWLEFVSSSMVGFCINWGSYLTLTSYLPFFDRYRLLALVCGVLIASLFNFAASTLFVFSEKRGA